MWDQRETIDQEVTGVIRVVLVRRDQAIPSHPDSLQSPIICQTFTNLAVANMGDETAQEGDP